MAAGGGSCDTLPTGEVLVLSCVLVNSEQIKLFLFVWPSYWNWALVGVRHLTEG